MKIAYFYDPDVGNFYYAKGHPMKPQRIALTHSLVINYGLHKRMDVYYPKPATRTQLERFHTPEYINFLKYGSVLSSLPSLQEPSEDCPLFHGVYDFSRRTAGASIQAASLLCSGRYSTCINWSGGLHHARKSAPSGFCYVNDIVLGIQRLLESFKRVLYIDIDVHHGDGVQDAFYTSNRVMTVSLHKYGEGFFPNTGNVFETGCSAGAFCGVNVPLKSGIDDHSYFYVFKPVIDTAIERFRPEAIVLQCGADSLGMDRLGPFNLSIRGHGECVRYVRDLEIPLLVLGGGGYVIRNVARCWAYETSVLCDQRLSNNLPGTEFSDHFAPDHRLHLMTNYAIVNENTRQYLDNVRAVVCEQMRRAQPYGV